ncbi:hypothetical protein VNO80_10571 [Phaseolus coccineus]|uniref:Uncharacterized protein n=1 Tax=Phaseolus coccineus TaxID=3886 RepID=A0AAN9NDP8_PHACN
MHVFLRTSLSLSPRLPWWSWSTSCCLSHSQKSPQSHPTSCLDLLSQAEEEMNWIQRKIYLYNVTFGLYMLDWWERCTFNILVIVLMCFVLRYVTRFFKRYVC